MGLDEIDLVLSDRLTQPGQVAQIERPVERRKDGLKPIGHEVVVHPSSPGDGDNGMPPPPVQSLGQLQKHGLRATGPARLYDMENVLHVAGTWRNSCLAAL